MAIRQINAGFGQFLSTLAHPLPWCNSAQALCLRLIALMIYNANCPAVCNRNACAASPARIQRQGSPGIPTPQGARGVLGRRGVCMHMHPAGANWR